MIRLVPLLQERGCRTIGVFNVRESTLAKRTEQPVFVGSPADELVAIQTYTGTLATLGLLGAAYENEWENATTALNETIAALHHLISECSSFCKSRNNFIEGTATLYLLARGAALASVEEGVLLMHEVAKAPAVGMSAAQFRHGPVEAIHKDFRAVIFGTQPVTMALDLSLAQDLSGMGAQVLWLGPEPNNTNLLTVSWPEKPAGRFAGILEAVPLQLLAYYMAIERGISPGKFRYTAAITSSETGFAHGKTI
ncbi:MAG: hypothetical protein JO270_22100 [Acidobacteriaceae bacterium]|nr:hypothetical protein [Acidobacteriaceae bacterium]